jgi:hypothetical protein
MIEKQEKKIPNLVLVSGPWSSGTSVVAQMLSEIGLVGIEPYFKTNDERTKNSYESIAFRNAMMQIASQDDLQMKVSRKEAYEILRDFRDRLVDKMSAGNAQDKIFLKYPLSAMVIPEICQLFKTKMIYVLRPLKDIESTKIRRGWPDALGAKGAKVIYSHMFDAMVNFPFPTTTIRYPHLLSNPESHAKILAAFCGVNDPELIENATKVVRK